LANALSALYPKESEEKRLLDANAIVASPLSTRETTDRGLALMATFACPYLGSEVQLTEERERHNTETHPDLLTEHRDKVAGALADPDEDRQSARFAGARVFSKWHDGLRGGKFVVVVVVTEAGPTDRSWIVTAYIAWKLVGGNVEWARN
jgi:hypothetical protein